MYDRILDGKELTFGVSGKLWKNALVMYDRQTNTLWSQILGEGLIGPLKGKRLKALPTAVFITYKEWKQLYPDTKVLDKGKVGGLRALFGGSSRDPYEGYYYSRQTGVIPQKYRDNRLHPKTYVVAVAFDNPGGGEKIAKAYPFADLNRAGVVNDTFALQELLVTYCESGKSGVVFDRRIGGKTLTFETPPGGEGAEKSCGMMRDRETGSLWRRMTGEAVSGAMKGKKLSRVPSTLAFWFGWKDYFPKSKIYRHAN